MTGATTISTTSDSALEVGEVAERESLIAYTTQPAGVPFPDTPLDPGAAALPAVASFQFAGFARSAAVWGAALYTSVMETQPDSAVAV